jgi:hypothetical protein
MFTFGEQLYRLTQRDEETLLVEDYFRRIDLSITPGNVTAQASLFLPKDRCLYVSKVIFTGFSFAGFAGNWIAWSVNLFDTAAGDTTIAINGSAADTRPLIGDGTYGPTALGLGEGVVQSKRIQTVFPPGFAQLNFNAFTTAKPVATATARLFLHAYLLPPGRIGRR